MKKRISRNLRIGRYLFIVLGIIFSAALFYSLSVEFIDLEEIIVEAIFLSICLLLYYLFDHAKTVEFDHNHMYVSGKKEKEKIPLEKVFKIKLTMTEINKRNMWKISYYDKNNDKKAVRILPRSFYKHFNEFKDAVQAVNKDLIYKSYSHSLDFDL